MKSAVLVTVPIVTVWRCIQNLFIRRELSGAGIKVDVDVEIKEGEKELKKLFMVLIAITLLTGCSFSKQSAIAETLARIVGRDLGYRSEQIKAMADSQATVDPLMAANLKDLALLLEPDAGMFTSGLDVAATDGWIDGQKLYTGE